MAHIESQGPTQRLEKSRSSSKALSHVIELGKGAQDPNDKVHFIGDAPATADRLISIWLTNHTGHDMTLVDYGHGSGSLWAKPPPQSIPNGQARHFQVNSVAAGNDASGHVTYMFDGGALPSKGATTGNTREPSELHRQRT